MPPDQSAPDLSTVAALAQSPASKGENDAAAGSVALDEPQQMNLFDIPEPHAEVVRKLRLPAHSSAAAPIFMDEERVSGTNTMVVNTAEALRVLVKSLHDAGSFSLDTETTSEDPRSAELVGISCSMAAGEA